MDILKFYDITHREHVICNPTNSQKLDRLVELLALPQGAKVVDIACGKGEFLLRLAQKYEISGEGVDLSHFHIDGAQKRYEKQETKGTLSFVAMNGADYEPREPHSLDLASCIGASWIYGGHRNTLERLKKFAKPDGWIVVGEPYWRKTPPEEYLKALGLKRDEFGSHLTNAETGEQLGLELLYAIVSSKDDWDAYEGLQWYAMDKYARAHGDDPDLHELRKKVNGEKSAYLHWGREVLGWAIYMFRAPI